VLDLKPLLQTLSKMSVGRILAESETTESDDLCQARIPVASPNPADRKDVVMRKYAQDWVKQRGDFTVEARFESAIGKSWYDDKEEIPLYGIIVLTWWKPETGPRAASSPEKKPEAPPRRFSRPSSRTP
jgi:hypothetical protein